MSIPSSWLTGAMQVTQHVKGSALQLQLDAFFRQPYRSICIRALDRSRIEADAPLFANDGLQFTRRSPHGLFKARIEQLLGCSTLFHVSHSMAIPTAAVKSRAFLGIQLVTAPAPFSIPAFANHVRRPNDLYVEPSLRRLRKSESTLLLVMNRQGLHTRFDSIAQRYGLYRNGMESVLTEVLFKMISGDDTPFLTQE